MVFNELQLVDYRTLKTYLPPSKLAPGDRLNFTENHGWDDPDKAIVEHFANYAGQGQFFLLEVFFLLSDK